MKSYIPLIVAFALFMETIDSTVINTAIPQMAYHLQTDPINLKMALTSYLLSLAIFIPISGWFADRFGSQKVFIAAIIIFIVGSLFCGLATSLESLVLFRMLQGLGGALMMPVGRLILLKSFPKNDLVKVMNYVTIPSQIGHALGPLLGGIMVSYLNWRWIFFINIPIGMAGLFFAAKALPNYFLEKPEKLDLLGFILFGVGLASFAFAFQSIGEKFLSPLAAWGLVLLSIILLGIYFFRSKKIKNPFIDLAIFNTPTFSITVLGSFISRCCIGGIPLLLPLFFQLGFNTSPLVSGLLLLPYAIAMLIVKFFVKSSLRWLGFKNLLILNTFLLGVSTLTFALMDHETSFIFISILVFVNGIFTSMQFSCMNVLSYVDLPENYISKGTSIGSAMQMLSMSFGIAIAAMILEFFSRGGDAFHIQVQAFQYSFLILGILTIISSATFFFLKKNDGAEASGHEVSIAKTS